MQSDVRAKFGDAAAPDRTESQSDLQLTLKVQTPHALTQAAELKESVLRTLECRNCRKSEKGACQKASIDILY